MRHARDIHTDTGGAKWMEHLVGFLAYILFAPIDKAKQFLPVEEL